MSRMTEMLPNLEPVIAEALSDAALEFSGLHPSGGPYCTISNAEVSITVRYAPDDKEGDGFKKAAKLYAIATGRVPGL
jgi:hypothetical protein